MYKYILLASILFVGIQKSNAQTMFLFQQKIDSAYNILTEREKVESIVLKSNDSRINISSTPNDTVFSEDIDSLCTKLNLTFNKNSLKAALMEGSNVELKKNITKLLVSTKSYGYAYNRNSAFANLFANIEEPILDYFFMPNYRIVIPYVYNSQIRCYALNSFNMPKDILASNLIMGRKSYSSYFYKELELRNSSGSIKLLESQNAKKEKPSLQAILQQGGVVLTDNPDSTVNRIMSLIDMEQLSIHEFEKSCKNILLYKYLRNMQVNYRNSKVINTEFAHQLNTSAIIDKLNVLINREGTVLLQNTDSILPIRNLMHRNVLVVNLTDSSNSTFYNYTSKYTSCTNANSSQIESILNNSSLNNFNNYNTILFAIDQQWYNTHKSTKLIESIETLGKSSDIALAYFGSGELIKNLPATKSIKAITISMDNTDLSYQNAAQLLFGGIEAKGLLPFNLNDKYHAGAGVKLKKSRLGYAPTNYALISDSLDLVEQIAYKAIREKATPGCQILIAKNGDIVYDKSFGYFTYSKKRKVTNNDLYDLASVTKITASVPMIMKMVDDGKVSLNDTLGHILPHLQNSNKQGIELKYMLLHQAGLKSWIPFYLSAIDSTKLNGNLYSRRYSSKYNIKVDTRLYMNKTTKFRSDVFRNTKSNDFSVQVCNKMYMNKSYVDTMWQTIDSSDVRTPAKYLYSDLGYYYLKEIIENTYKTRLDTLTQKYFYGRLGASHTTYLPLQKYDKGMIAPTEDDKQWRHELVQGYVHDPGAAMLGGVGGHAGLFSNTEDLAKMYQMYLQMGSYGNERYINAETIKNFTSNQIEGNRRGLGFDKPQMDPDEASPVCREASEFSYGHSGFTGTLVWVDPKYNLVYIFLSNRVHPHQYNKKLISTSVRTDIQEAIYSSVPSEYDLIVE